MIRVTRIATSSCGRRRRNLRCPLLKLRVAGLTAACARCSSPPVLQGVGANLNFDSKAVGKALIAWMPRAELSDLIEQYGLSNTASGVEVSQSKLFQELEAIQECGYATSTWTRVRALAAPICDTRGVVCAGLTVAGSQTQVAWKHLDTLIALVLEAAQ